MTTTMTTRNPGINFEQMKKILYLFALLLCACCTREALPGPDGCTGGIVCRIESQTPATKTTLKDDPGVRMVSIWQDGDQIGIFGNSASNENYRIVSSTISSDGRSAEFQSRTLSVSGNLLAYSPYQAGATGSGNSLTVEFPSTQQYAAGGNISGPDPAANILAGSGETRKGISLRPVAAILKIGQVFDEQATLSKVEFRDLGGGAVCGAMSITPGEVPASEITGNGKVITLTFGDGLSTDMGQKITMYMFVPARSYAKGFSLTFITTDGRRTEKTVGTLSGKTLEAGTVYPVGDITRYEYLSGNSFELMDGALLVTPEIEDYMKVTHAGTEVLLDVDGNGIHHQDGLGYYNGPELELLVRDELKLEVGNYLLFEQGSDILPGGGVLKVTDATPLGGGYYRVIAQSEANVAAPYSKLLAGDEMYDDEGNLLEGTGIDLDLSSYITDVKDGDGNSIPFGVSSAGELLFGEEAASRVVGIPTKSIATPSFSFPGLSLNVKSDNLEATFSAALTLSSRLATGAVNGEFQYLYITVNPVFDFSADFKAKVEGSKSLSQHLVTLVCAPIPIAPGVLLTPELEIRGYVAFGGSIVFSTSVKYKYDMGTFGVAYNKGAGFTTRYVPPEPEKEEGVQFKLGGLTGTLSASGGFTLYPNFSIYGLLEVGAQIDCGLQFGIEDTYTAGWTSPRVFLQPIMEMYPKITSLGGYLTKHFKNLTVSPNFDPIWERYFYPKAAVSFGAYGSQKNRSFACRAKDDNGNDIIKVMSTISWVPYGTIFTHLDGFGFRVKSPLPTANTWDLYFECLSGGTMDKHDEIYFIRAPIFNSSSLGPGLTVASTGMTVKESHKILHIPAGEKDIDITTSVSVSIPVNTPFAVRFVMVNADTGAMYDFNRKEASQTDIYSSETFIVSWPKTPDGYDYFEVKEYYDADKFNLDIPIKSLDSMYEPDFTTSPQDVNLSGFTQF